MAVFTRKWVDLNLAAFLDGKNASAIVTLGQAAIEAKEEEDSLKEEIERLLGDASEANSEKVKAGDKASALAREVQDRIVSELREFDYIHFTKNRYTILRVSEDLRNAKDKFPDSKVYAESLRLLGESAPGPVAEIFPPNMGIAEGLEGLGALLADTPTRVALEALERSVKAQTWVEQGLEMHQDLDLCLFCDSRIDSERRRQLSSHFDESWLQIRSRAKELHSAVAREKNMYMEWQASLPESSLLVGELQSGYAKALDQVNSGIEERILILDLIESALGEKIADPSVMPSEPEWSMINDPLSIRLLVESIGEHNDQARRHEDVVANRKGNVLSHIVGSKGQEFRDLEKEEQACREKCEASNQTARLAEVRLGEVRQAQFTTKDMADKLSDDLSRVYGKSHLNITVTEDGKSYSCHRGGRAATDLSEGERTTLSLLYFLRKLEDEEVVGGDRAQRMVIIDDPSSSLDREALFATHHWLLDALKGVGQYVIFTHDFSLLRLFIKSHKNAWGKSMKRIKAGDLGEAMFPKVEFLEMYATSINGERKSNIGRLTPILLNNTSEYAYLFSMVMAGIADSEDHERLFLLPNAARRVLEVFASYKAPHRFDFMQQLEELVRDSEGEPFRDVYDFCNRYSHGEGNESVDVLDARVVHGQIRRCMDFLRSIDDEHFRRMCEATGVDPGVLP